MEKDIFNKEITAGNLVNESFIKKYIKVPVYTLDKMTLLY